MTTSDRLRQTVRCALALLIGPLLLVSECSAPRADAPHALRSRILAQRALGDYQAALELAQSAARGNTNAEGSAVDLADAALQAQVLRSVLTLPAALRRELAEADRAAGAVLSAERIPERSVLEAQIAVRRRILGDACPDLPLWNRMLARALLDEGEPGQAQRIAERVLAHDLAEQGRNHPETAESLHLLALIEYELRHYEQAIPLCRESLEIVSGFLGSESLEAVDVERTLAMILRMNRQTEEARARLEHCLKVRRRDLGPKDPRVADCWLGLANYWRLSDPDRAAKYFERSLSVLRSTLGPEDPELIQILKDYGIARIMRGDLRSAEKLQREGLGICRRRYGVEHRLTLESLIYLASNVLAQGRLAEAESLYRECAAGFEVARRRLGQDTERVMGMGSPYPGLAASLLAQSKFDEAWEATERTWARGLLDALSTFPAGKNGGPDHLRCDSLSARLASAEQDLRRAEARAGASELPDSAICAARHAAIRAEAAWDSLRERLAARNGEEQGAPASLERIRRSLDEGTAIIGWMVFWRTWGNAAWGYVIRSDGPVRWVNLLPKPILVRPPDMLGRIVTLSNALSVAAGWPCSLEDDYGIHRQAGALYDDLFRPLEPFLEGIDRLVVVTGWPCQQTPVELLEDAKGVPLNDRYAISYAPSPTIYAALAERRPGGSPGVLRKVLLVGDPSFLSGQSVEIEAATVHHLEPLPHARREVSRLAALFPGSTVLLGSGASREVLQSMSRSGALGRFDAIHFATHVLVDYETPGRSALVFAQGRPSISTGQNADFSRSSDGYVTSGEISRSWSLNADLVTLSGCQTGTGPVDGGGSITGLPISFFEAGARSLVASLWRVQDRPTALLMERFYENLRTARTDSLSGREERRMTKAEALREARIWLRDQRDGEGRRPYSHPVCWAGFVLIGDDR